MINFQVDDLDALLAALKDVGVEIDPKREDFDYGRFAWIMDPEGNKVELWEPPNGGLDEAKTCTQEEIRSGIQTKRGLAVGHRHLER